MPRRLFTSGLLAALSLLFWTSTAAGFALFDEIHIDVRDMPLPLLRGRLDEVLSAPGMPAPQRAALMLLAEDDLLAGPPLALHRENAFQYLVLAPDSLWPDGLTVTAPASADAEAVSAPVRHTVLPMPPTVALLGLGGMMILGMLRQGMIS